MSKEAMKLALEALEHAIPHKKRIGDDGYLEAAWEFHNKAITALREALAEQPAPVSQPNRVVAYSAAMKLRELGYEWMNDKWKHLDDLAEPPAQRAWVGLSQDEFRDFASTLEYGTGGLIRAIEAKLKEKNQ